MKKERKEKDFLNRPVYPGGLRAMRQFIQSELRYPAEAAAHGITGTVHLRISIDHQGRVIDAKVVSSLGYGCDEEAQRVAGLLRFQVEKNRKIRAIFHKKLNIHFREAPAPQPKQAPSPVSSLQYTLTPTPPRPEAEAPVEPPKKAYHYAITLG